MEIINQYSNSSKVSKVATDALRAEFNQHSGDYAAKTIQELENLLTRATELLISAQSGEVQENGAQARL